jgi:DNA mismatch repair ATPase MutS
MTPIDYYQKKQDSNRKELEELRKKITSNSILRLITFVGIFVFLFGLIRISPWIAVSSAILALALFLFLVRRHIFLQKRKQYEMELEKILVVEINACNHDFSGFSSGEQNINHRHTFSYDLDIFGKGSVFSMLNRTVTDYGAEMLAGFLLERSVNNLDLIEKQEAIKELCSLSDFMLHFRATGKVSALEVEDREKINSWLAADSFFTEGSFKRLVHIGMPLLTILALVYTIINPAFGSVSVLLFLINLGYISKNLRKINHEHNQVSSLLKLLQKYNDLIYILEGQEFHSSLLKYTMRQLRHQETKAGEGLGRLTKLVSVFDNRLNFLVAIFLEGILLWDYHCLRAINKWKKEFGPKLPEWLEIIAFFDACISLSGYTFNNPGFVYPKLSDDTILTARDLGHPLISPSVRVCNDFDLKKQGEFIIITGANMAGKSTFLRTVGVNLILARLGVPVCASEFSFKPMRLFTSMRTSDSLAENESYFYAELRRLKEMLKELEKEGEEGDILIILDEILKGTNSVDKQNGSFAAMEKILKLGGTGIIATHDLALTNIADKFPDKIKNKCFEIEIDNAKISFDYKLYDGVTKKMNAMLLMEQMGII